MDENIPRFTSYAVYISQLIRFAGVSSHVTDFNLRTNLTAIGIINFENLFQNLIAHSMNWFLNSRSD